MNTIESNDVGGKVSVEIQSIIVVSSDIVRCSLMMLSNLLKLNR